MVAGSDTGSITLTVVFYCLLTHPEAYARLQAEVDEFYPAGEPALDTKHHRYMHYLQAVMCACSPLIRISELTTCTEMKPSGSMRQYPSDPSAKCSGVRRQL